MSEQLLSLVEACKKDEKEAWGPFVKECGKIIRGYLLTYCRGKREEIDEITSRVWLKLLKGGLRDFRGTSQYRFLAYLKTITINEAHTYFGPMRPKPPDDDTLTAKPTSPSPSGVEGQPDGDLGEKMDLEKEKEKLQECIKGLPVKQQEIAWMKAKDYKDVQIGKRLGLSLGAVAGTYAQLKIKLKKCMERAEK